jgi:hypothetical protein
VGQWSLRRIDNADFTTEVSIENGIGALSIDAADELGNFRNFLNLQAVVVSPKGERQTVRIEQTGPGHYEARFPTKEAGSYLVNLLEIKDGQVRGSQVVGASINYSPEFNAVEPNLHLLRRLAESGGGQLIDPNIPGQNPFLQDRRKTYQPRNLWETLLKLAIILFVLDVGVRRIQIDREEWQRALNALRRRPAPAQESLGSLLARRSASRKIDQDLFRPASAPAPVIDQQPTPSAAGRAAPVAPPEPEPAASPAPPEGTTSRLLEAKRRAQQRSRRK